MSLASIALSLAPLAADMVGKIINMKKEGKSEKGLKERIDKLENYEVEQAKLIKKLINKVEYLQVQQKRSRRLAMTAFIFALLSLLILLGALFMGSEFTLSSEA